MATKESDLGVHEFCDQCNQETPHDVTIELRTESSKEENTEFSREPYRVSECRTCEHENVIRMNNA